ncbi:argininosuccinate synthase, chloroplastic-like isoform X1 [Trifolium pratense]|uniref:argininosuccinate synthase, chloroplastic-like isoform X1 n=1 Tax=Trifolium pratense TaxID=57577 RepID=UPI001E6962E9|nr:argininosuccinate synthase, chloroplastic-like isoform X1 [Trifolium pratense]XP_045810680.1 argininosuccinate synthase, chloroplastic-like isoform X1 [Trifolium pratense]XP_045810687.1 argininosuccinate synthase, chloroplastic-like isoform X1 [Trifolium pratense]XP_045810692.1 argininosuccinate synthase, chloroplastic-like isoform X1 [Trifolium pratense]XP_045810694.1 argininosuccinate synthase, chloroplastic-like isoform X1 [Trifolium pratense]
MQAIVDIAEEVGADAVSYSCTGKRNYQVRFELSFFALNPKLNVVAPWREWDITGREDAIEYANNKHNVLVPVTKKSIYSKNQNLCHITRELECSTCSSQTKTYCDEKTTRVRVRWKGTAVVSLNHQLLLAVVGVLLCLLLI